MCVVGGREVVRRSAGVLVGVANVGHSFGGRSYEEVRGRIGTLPRSGLVQRPLCGIKRLHPSPAKMKRAKCERLEANGWKVGTVAEFLGLTPEESALIEIKLALAHRLRERRQKRMTQAQLAERIQSSQSRVAKAETGDSSVSLELLVRAILATGASPKEIARVIAGS